MFTGFISVGNYSFYKFIPGFTLHCLFLISKSNAIACFQFSFENETLLPPANSECIIFKVTIYCVCGRSASCTGFLRAVCVTTFSNGSNLLITSN